MRREAMPWKEEEIDNRISHFLSLSTSLSVLDVGDPALVNWIERLGMSEDTNGREGMDDNGGRDVQSER